MSVNGLTRDVDLYLLGSRVRGRLDLKIKSGTGGLLAFGVAEAVQKFLILLFQSSGPTSLLGQLRSGRLRTEAELTMAFSSAAHNAMLLSVRNRSEAYDPDEEIVGVEVVSCTVSGGSVTLSARLRTAAGAAVEFTAPVAVG